MFRVYGMLYAAVLINLPILYAHVKDLCLGIWTVLLEYIHLYK